jgi:N-formylglutamate deformylase
MGAFNIIPAKGSLAPILISVPHCGIKFPEEIKAEFKPDLIQAPDDTDWFVHQLYDFAPSMGITMITAEYSRWVVDLNRDPESKPLYTDGRIITGLCPTTNFLGENIYKDDRDVVHQQEVARRLQLYYNPYHDTIRELLHNLKVKFKNVLLWDCHSIRQIVATIQKEKFPDLILGSVEGTSASPVLIKTALQCLGNSNYSIQHNHPFKGGHITRHFCKPEQGYHALQLEMTKVMYMDDDERQYDTLRAEKMREVLRFTLEALADNLINT